MRDVRLEDSNFIGRDLNIILARSAADTLRNLRTPLSKQELQKATEGYYCAILDRHRFLNMKGMGICIASLCASPCSTCMYHLRPVWKYLKATPGAETYAWLVAAQVAEEQGALTASLSAPQPVLDLLQHCDGLIILGDPGAGKTTFLKFLALRLALGEGSALGLGARLPVLLPLSAYANALSQRDALRLDDFMAEYLHDSGADLPMPEMMKASLVEGAALILLDGLDEVKDPSLRNHVAERVADFFSFHRRAGNKFVLTSRMVGYRAVRPSAEGLAECTLVDFDDDEIAAFVASWTIALERQAQGESVTVRAEAERERQDLLAAIHRNPSVRRLAANPLLLTILALMKRQGVTLPECRVELYDQYVKTLLSTWNRARGLGRPPQHDLDVVQTMRILAPLALWMHQVNPGVGLVKRAELQRKLEAIYSSKGEVDPEARARQFLEDVREYAGLLLERGPGEYGFIHLTFEEYLAAVAVALASQGDCRPIVNTLADHVDDPAWREVALLTVGYLGLIQQLDRVAGDVVEALVSEQPGQAGEAVVLAGEAVLDAWPGGVPVASKDRVVDALVPAMQGAGVQPMLRRRAGMALGRLGWRPGDMDQFMPVQAGEFLYGDERQPRTLPYRFWVGKYPVTNAQYARFMEDRGYEREEFWKRGRLGLACRD